MKHIVLAKGTCKTFYNYVGTRVLEFAASNFPCRLSSHTNAVSSCALHCSEQFCAWLPLWEHCNMYFWKQVIGVAVPRLYWHFAVFSSSSGCLFISLSWLVVIFFKLCSSFYTLAALIFIKNYHSKHWRSVNLVWDSSIRRCAVRWPLRWKIPGVLEQFVLFVTLVRGAIKFLCYQNATSVCFSS